MNAFIGVDPLIGYRITAPGDADAARAKQRGTRNIVIKRGEIRQAFNECRFGTGTICMTPVSSVSYSNGVLSYNYQFKFKHGSYKQQEEKEE